MERGEAPESLSVMDEAGERMAEGLNVTRDSGGSGGDGEKVVAEWVNAASEVDWTPSRLEKECAWEMQDWMTQVTQSMQLVQTAMLATGIVYENSHVNSTMDTGEAGGTCETTLIPLYSAFTSTGSLADGVVAGAAAGLFVAGASENDGTAQ